MTIANQLGHRYELRVISRRLDFRSVVLTDARYAVEGVYRGRYRSAVTIHRFKKNVFFGLFKL